MCSMLVGGVAPMRAVPRLFHGVFSANSAAAPSGAASPTTLTPDDIRSILSREHSQKDLFSKPNSVNQRTIARAFGAHVTDELVYEAKSLLLAQTMIRERFFNHDVFRQFGISNSTEYLPPQETLKRIISEACCKASIKVENDVPRGKGPNGLPPPELFGILKGVATNASTTINDTLDELVGELYYLSMLGQYFFAKPYEEIGATILKVKNGIESVERQLSWCRQLYLNGDFREGNVQKAYRETGALWGEIDRYCRLGVRVPWRWVHDSPNYTAAKEKISSYFPREHVDELLDFLLKYRVDKDLLIKDLGFSLSIDLKELQALERARDSGAALVEP